MDKALAHVYGVPVYAWSSPLRTFLTSDLLASAHNRTSQFPYASPSQGRWDPDSLRPAPSLGGQASAWECSPGRSLCLTKSSACGRLWQFAWPCRGGDRILQAPLGAAGPRDRGAFVTPWTAACQASLYFTTFQNLFRFITNQPSHPLLPPSPPAFTLSQHQGLFQ